MKVLKKILILFIVSRLIIFGFLSIGQTDELQYPDNQVKLENPIVDPFIIYDSYNYAQIATEGYNEDRLTAFFPLFPLIVRVIAEVSGMDVYWAGFVLSNFFFVCAMWLLYKLMEKRGLSERIRNLTLFVLAFFPSSYFFSAFYTESFFLFLALLAFRFWENEKRGVAYFIGGLAALSRIVGVWLPLAFFVERLIRRRLDIKDFVFATMSSLMFFIYPVYLWLTKGEPLLFLKVMAPDYGRHSTIPFYPIYQDIVSSIERFKETSLIEPIIVFHMILFIMFIFYLISTIRQGLKDVSVRWSEFVYTIGLIIMPLSSVLIQPVNIPSHGFMRYFLTIFPLFIFIGKQLEHVVARADKNSGYNSLIVWKPITYIILIIWVTLSFYVLLMLRFKGFVA
jgi:hypothetical protein